MGLRQTEGLRPGSPICFGQTRAIPFPALLAIFMQQKYTLKYNFFVLRRFYGWRTTKRQIAYYLAGI